MLRWLGRLGRRPSPALDPARWQRVRSGLPWVATLDAERDARLSSLTAHFLDRKAITPAQGLHLDDDARCALAALCCMPLLEFGEQGLHGWSELIVHPGAFRVERRHVDLHDMDALDIVHEGVDEIDGESWDYGPLVLSWADIQAEIRDPHAGGCLTVHEMAHKLDALDGAMDGTPPLPRAWQREWARDFQHAYDEFCAEVDAGRDTRIPPDAADSPEEFFAVCSETHFCAPERLRAQSPAVAAHLRRFYGAFDLSGASIRN